ncbi:MAG: carbonic anhydrase family protein [Burkholderiales bacterium]|nr:carbonic anhydrase family protein [Burkholderiales bacterium]
MNPISNSRYLPAFLAGLLSISLPIAFSAPAQAEAAEAKTAETKTTGKRLEDDPYALDRLKNILQSGIPELMTVKVKNNAAGSDSSSSSASSGSGGRKNKTAGSEQQAPAALGLAPAVAKGKANTAHEAHWSYEGETGPYAWGKMKPEFNTCDNGKAQSPIHIQPGDTVTADLEPLSFDYGPLLGKITHNGHTIQVDLSGNHMLTVKGKVFKLVQFHFHHPAEEMINYKGFAMVAHMVHKSADGKLAVVGVLIDTGEENPVLSKIWARMPMKEGESYPLEASAMNVAELLPKNTGYYTFAGSLTTPPCSEGVLWMVMKHPTSLSLSQLNTFKRLFPLNARPTQPMNARLVQESK